MIKDNIKYLLFSEIYLKIDEPKAKRKAMLIMEATLQCIARKGFDGVTLEMIARDAAVTRPLIKHYFGNRDDLLEIAIKYVRLLFQKLAVDFMSKEDREDRMLTQYVESCFYWIDHYRTHAQVWLSFLHRCTRLKEERAINTAAVEVGEQRITGLLQQGQKSGVFEFNNAQLVAKSIQTIITGALVIYGSEDLNDPKAYVQIIRRQCLYLAGAKASCDS